MKNHKTVPAWQAKYENVKNVPQFDDQAGQIVAMTGYIPKHVGRSWALPTVIADPEYLFT
jgi:hypothetical protein